MIKRLLVSVSSDYGQEFKVVPINTNQTVEIQSALGVFKLAVYIKGFDGSKKHLNNSCYNVAEETYLDGEPVAKGELNETAQHNLRLTMDFKPNAPIQGSDFLFGNDFTVPIRDYVPSLLLSTGLKIFTRFINPSLKGDIYCDKPFLYGLVLNSITYLTKANPGQEFTSPLPPANYDGGYGGGDYEENLNEEDESIPSTAGPRKTYYKSIDNCKAYTFKKDTNYRLTFDTISVKMADSKYAISIPTFAGRTFDIDAGGYANEKLDNFNWVLKSKGSEGVGFGTVGLVISFALIDEEPHPLIKSENSSKSSLASKKSEASSKKSETSKKSESSSKKSLFGRH